MSRRMPATDLGAEGTVPARPYISIREHNARIKWFVETSLVPFARRAVMYEVNSSRPCTVLVPPKDDWDPACGAFAGTDDLDVGDWFGDNHVIESVNYFPGTECFLANGYDIVMLAHQEDSAADSINSTICRMFGVEWAGNLLVVKRGRRDSTRAVNITRTEISLINAMVERWLQLDTRVGSDDDVSCA